MDKKKTIKLLNGLIADLDKQAETEHEIDVFINDLTETAKKVSVLSQAMYNFATAGAKQHKLQPPIPAFSKVNFDNNIANKAVERIMALNPEATELLVDITKFNTGYDAFLVKKTVLMKKTSELFNSLMKGSANLAVMNNELTEYEKRTKHYAIELAGFYTEYKKFIPRLASVKKQLNMVMGVS